MKKVLIITLITTLIAGFTLSGCATKAQTGAGIGALGGAAIGGQVGRSKHRARNAMIGAVAGALLGYAIGNEWDKYDQRRLEQVYENSRSYKTTSWVNPDTNRSYSVTPRPARNINGHVCRKAYIEAVIDGRVEKVETLACRQPDGTWKIQN